MTAYRIHITYEISYEVDTDLHDHYFDGDEPWLATASDRRIAEEMAEVDARNDVIEMIHSAKDVDLVSTRVERVEE